MAERSGVQRAALAVNGALDALSVELAKLAADELRVPENPVRAAQATRYLRARDEVLRLKEALEAALRNI
jgi:hypothetical protein